ncbi:hypothetical protein [Desulfobacter sp.]|uniref:hypothetical protein n=1 Tax=Desulfobacter sp. TaxID=2294 RepID=UPI003D0F085A
MTKDAKIKNTEIDNTDIAYDYSTFRAPVNNRYNGKKIYGWFSEPDIQWYRNTAADLYDGLMVEIGVWQGASLLSIADICAKNSIRQIGIDPAFHNEDELKQLILDYQVFSNKLILLNITVLSINSKLSWYNF